MEEGVIWLFKFARSEGAWRIRKAQVTEKRPDFWRFKLVDGPLLAMPAKELASQGWSDNIEDARELALRELRKTVETTQRWIRIVSALKDEAN